MTKNQLGDETSPYLLQHADNPVHWRAWSDAVFEQAEAENKPILLSVGYSACHWCHVMAHESFENEDTARLMNDLFINVKVDREERPDVDTIYQSALALMGQQGGWPLTMFCTPDGHPFWGGTYFPPDARYGRPGFAEVLEHMAALYRREPQKVANNVEAVKKSLTRMSRPRSGAMIDSDFLDRAAAAALPHMDAENGGFGRAPKFPQPSLLALLWRAYKRTDDRKFRHPVTLALTRMAQGGIYDHVGGGFHRYATDDAWLVPHFEKMLYDNAQLIDLYTLVWQETNEPLFAARVEETAAWLTREMISAGPVNDGRASRGGFCAALDADSEGEEGKYYVWTRQEIEGLLGARAAAFCEAYDVTAAGNWEGRTILNRTSAPGLRAKAEEDVLAAGREILLARRGERVPPGLDDKVLADWNGLTIAALVRASAAFARPEWLSTAEDAYAFIAASMQREGRLRHSWRAGRAHHPATLDDYANMALAALALYETTGDKNRLRQAEDWTEVANRHYWDDRGGGYYLTADTTTDVIVRTKNAHDAAVPSGNGAMAEVLARLFFLTGAAAYRQRADEVIKAFSGEIEPNPLSFSTLLNGVDLLENAVQIAVIGDRGEKSCDALLERIYAACLPNRVVQVVPPQDTLNPDHPASGKGQVNAAATVYLCQGPVCSAPICSAEPLDAALGRL